MELLTTRGQLRTRAVVFMQLRRSKRALATPAVESEASEASNPSGGASSNEESEVENVKKSRRRANVVAVGKAVKKTKATGGATTAAVKKVVAKSSSIPIVPTVISTSSTTAQFPLLSALKERRQDAGTSAASDRADDKIVYTYQHLVPGRLVKRYKRFLADIELVDTTQEQSGGDDAAVNEAKVVTVYCPNTGPMVGLLDLPNARVQLSKSEDPKRKYQYTLEMVQVDNGERRVWVGVHSTLANRMVEKAIAAHWLPELGLFSTFQREVKFSKNSRVDFVLSSGEEEVVARQKYVEVKSVSFAHPLDQVASAIEKSRFCALFPDTISDRAQKHVTELTELIENHTTENAKSKEISAAIVFLVQRDDCHEFAPSFLHDVKFAALCAQAAKKGIQLLAYSVALEPQEAEKTGHVRLLQALPLYEHVAKDEDEKVNESTGGKVQRKTNAPKPTRK